MIPEHSLRTKLFLRPVLWVAPGELQNLEIDLSTCAAGESEPGARCGKGRLEHKVQELRPFSVTCVEESFWKNRGVTQSVMRTWTGTLDTGKGIR